MRQLWAERDGCKVWAGLSLNSYRRLAWWVWRRYYWREWQRIGSRQLVEDLKQEVLTIAVEGAYFRLRERAFLRFANRKLHRFLVACGFRKLRGKTEYRPMEEPWGDTWQEEAPARKRDGSPSREWAPAREAA